MSSESQRPRGPLPAVRSEYADDPDMGRIIDLFVQEMPARVESLLASWRDRNLESLRRAAHQLRGAGGGYGFPAVSTAAGTLEASLARLSKGGGEHQLENLRKQFEELVELCRRVSAE